MSHLTKLALVISGVTVTLTLAGCGGGVNTVITSTTTVTSIVTTQPPASTTLLKEGLDFKMCPDGKSAIGSLVTSCEFALEVRQAYLKTGSDAVYVKSPVTREYYTMYCSKGYTADFKSGRNREVVVCDERDDAVVIVIL